MNTPTNSQQRVQYLLNELSASFNIAFTKPHGKKGQQAQLADRNHQNIIPDTTTVHRRILQAFDELERKTTQNLLIRKQNDDIKLQINTISGLFEEDIYEESSIEEAQSRISNALNKTGQASDSQEDSQFLLENSSLSTENYNQTYQNVEDDYTEPNVDLKANNSSSLSSLLEFNKNKKGSQRYKEQQSQQSNQKHQPKSSQKLSSSSLNKTLSLLLQQNASILERMNHLQEEVYFINGHSKGHDQDFSGQMAKKSFKNNGYKSSSSKFNKSDKSTQYCSVLSDIGSKIKSGVQKSRQSSKITSIGKIWEVKTASNQEY